MHGALCVLKLGHVLRFFSALRLDDFMAVRSASEGASPSGFVASRLCGVVAVKLFVEW